MKFNKLVVLNLLNNLLLLSFVFGWWGINWLTEPIFKKLSILKFEDLFYYNCLLFRHKYVHCNLLTEIF